MFITEDIRQVTMIIFIDDMEKTGASLGEAAIIHNRKGLVEKEISLPRLPLAGTVHRVATLLETACEFILPEAGQDVRQGEDVDVHDLLSHDMEGDGLFLERVVRQWRRYLSLAGTAEKEITRLKALADGQDDRGDLPDELKGSSLLTVMQGTVRPGEWGRAGEGYVLIQAKNRLTAVVLAGKREEVGRILDEAGFVEDAGMQGKDPAKTLNQLEARLSVLRDLMERKRRSWERKLLRLRDIYPCLEVLESEKGKWSQLRNMVLVSGWILKKRESELRAILEETAGSGYYLRVAGRWESLLGNPPVLFRNNRLVRPFELLVRAMGVPRNGEIDPSPVAGIIYMALFGMMFGDVGQGFLLSFAGLVMVTAWAADRTRADFGLLLVYCGVSAMTWGVLYGSVFSNEGLIRPVLFHPAEHVESLFALALAAGALCILSGLCMNMINHVLSGNPGDAVFEPDGLASLLIYTGGILAGVSIWRGNQGMSVPLRLGEAGILLLFLRGPLRALFSGKGKAFPHGIVEYLVESAAHLVEMASSFAGNTVSFIRTGAFALSHAGLGLAVYSLAGVASQPVVAGIVIVLGNVFIVLLEGLVCAIQSMRLEYYEIFSRFYRGDGVEFKPFSFPRHVYTRGGKE